MKRLSPKGKQWLKGFHVFFASMWVGAAIVLTIKQYVINPESGGELYGITATMDFIDIFVTKIFTESINFIKPANN